MTEHILSPSQIEAYVRCPRRWGYQYLQGKSEPTTKAAQAGTKVHDLLERYLRDATPIDESIEWEGFAIGKIAADMTQHLPEAGFCPTTEHAFELEANGIKYRGRVDLLTEDTVFDHKTTGSLKKAKSANKLKTDIQALIYGRWLGKDGFLQWTTGQTKGSVESKKTRLPIVYEEVVKRFDEIVDPIAKEILAEYEKNEPKTLERKKGACFLFPPNGCPRRIECKIEEDKLEKKMNLVEMLKAKDKQVEPERAAAVAADIAAIAVIQNTPTLYGVSAETAQPPKLDPINSPEGQLRASILPVAPAVEQRPISETGPAPGMQLRPEPSDALPKKPRKKRMEPPVEVLQEHGVKFAETEPRPQLRDGQTDVLPMVAVIGDRLPAIDDNSQNTRTLTDKPIRTLFVQCLPLGGQVRFAHDMIAKAAQTVENDLELHHVLLAPYSTGGASLAAQLRNDILSSGENGYDLVLMNRTPEARAIEQTLASLAQFVVVGL